MENNNNNNSRQQQLQHIPSLVLSNNNAGDDENLDDSINCAPPHDVEANRDAVPRNQRRPSLVFGVGRVPRSIGMEVARRLSSCDLPTNISLDVIESEAGLLEGSQNPKKKRKSDVALEGIDIASIRSSISSKKGKRDSIISILSAFQANEDIFLSEDSNQKDTDGRTGVPNTSQTDGTTDGNPRAKARRRSTLNIAGQECPLHFFEMNSADLVELTDDTDLVDAFNNDNDSNETTSTSSSDNTASWLPVASLDDATNKTTNYVYRTVSDEPVRDDPARRRSKTTRSFRRTSLDLALSLFGADSNGDNSVGNDDEQDDDKDRGGGNENSDVPRPTHQRRRSLEDIRNVKEISSSLGSLDLSAANADSSNPSRSARHRRSILEWVTSDLAAKNNQSSEDNASEDVTFPTQGDKLGYDDISNQSQQTPIIDNEQQQQKQQQDDQDVSSESNNNSMMSFLLMQVNPGLSSEGNSYLKKLKKAMARSDLSTLSLEKSSMGNQEGLTAAMQSTSRSRMILKKVRLLS